MKKKIQIQKSSTLPHMSFVFSCAASVRRISTSLFLYFLDKATKQRAPHFLHFLPGCTFWLSHLKHQTIAVG